MFPTRPSPIVFAFVLASCSHGSSPADEDPFTTTPSFTGKAGTPIAAVVERDILFVPAKVNGEGRTLGIDTGSPVFSLTDPSTTGIEHVSLEIGGVSFANVGAAVTSQGVGSTLGCSILCGFAIGLNYRDARFTLGVDRETAAPPDLFAEAVAPFELLGGGAKVIFQTRANLPASRIVLTAMIEGVPRRVVIDSGAGTCVVRSSIFDALVADARSTLSLVVATQSGVQTAREARLRSIQIAGAEVTRAPVIAGPALDAILQDDDGQPFDVILGGSFLREFYVVVDYPNRSLHLSRYTTRDHVREQEVRVGIEVDASHTVQHVLPGSDAEKVGVTAGDVVLAVDGVPTDEMTQLELAATLVGPIGSSHRLTLDQGVVTVDRTVKVEDVLPIP